MILRSRNLLFFLCLITFFRFGCFAAESSTQTPELLEPKFIQIEVSNVDSYSISVIRTFQNIAQFIQARYYSLLNWKQYSRHTNLEIENYDRKVQFGRWVNDPTDQDCLNTRAKILVRDSVKVVTFKENSKCVIAEGRWSDPYTGTTFNLASEIQIDHLVPLKNAYLSGAYKWDFKARCLYANYLGYDFHLISASGTENLRKSDRAPDKYMPPKANYACTYVRNWLTVKLLWGLSMTESEAAAIRQILVDQNCSTAAFRISDAELDRQRKFAQAHIDLCEKMDPTNR